MRTLIVYGDWLVKRQHFKRLHQENKQQKLKCGGLVGLFQVLHELIYDIRPNRIVVAWDGLQVGVLKYAYYPPWQIQKKADSEKIQRFLLDGDLAAQNEDEEHEQAILRQKIKVQHMLENCFVRQLYSDTAEAADLIAAYVQQAEREADEILIYSRPHEFYQLVNHNVSVVLPDKTIITVENYDSIVGYDQRNELMLTCFVGNESGSVPGIKGLSRKKLVKYFPVLQNDKMSYQDMCEYAEIKSDENDIQIYRLVLEAKDILLRNARALNLQNPYITQEDGFLINQMLRLPLSSDRNIEEAKKYFHTDGYSDYINESVEDFFSIFYSLMISEKEYKKLYNTIMT